MTLENVVPPMLVTPPAMQAREVFAAPPPAPRATVRLPKFVMVDSVSKVTYSVPAVTLAALIVPPANRARVLLAAPERLPTSEPAAPQSVALPVVAISTYWKVVTVLVVVSLPPP